MTKAVKAFSRHITADELIAACKREAFPISTTSYDRGGDHISFGFEHEGTYVTALFSVVNGRAFGKYGGFVGQTIQFSTDSPLDGTPWFDALLAFLYRP